MKAGCKIGKWRSLTGVLVLGLVAFGISADLEGAARKTRSDTNQVGRISNAISGVSTPRTTGSSGPHLSPAAWMQRMRQASQNGYPVFEPQVVDYRNDEPSRLRRAGLLSGPLPLPTGLGTLAAPHTVCTVANKCTFDIDCDDGNPCTTDTCTIPPEGPLCAGDCVNAQVGAGLPGGCDDGLFCNGLETCDASGACVAGLLPACCLGTTDLAVESCSETLATCSDTSDVAGRRCLIDGDCPGGVCDHCVNKCTADIDCDDGKACNGAEVCNTATGICEASPPPCGNGTNCFEKQCVGAFIVKECVTQDDCDSGGTCGNKKCTGFGGGPCSTDADCTSGQTCIAANVCKAGRCCQPGAAVDDCLARSLSVCSGSGGNFYPGDNGQDTETLGECGGNVPLPGGSLGQQLGCPSYTSGVTQSSATLPVHPEIAGPMSFSSIPVLAPSGPGGTAGLNRIGDDFCNSTGQHISVEAIRFVGAMSVPDAIFMEFWDADGNFIEDTLFRPSLTVGVNVIFINPPIVVPPCGRIAARTKVEFEPDARFIWASSDAPDQGTNDANILFVNDNPNFDITASGMLGGSGGGILSFELAGRPVPQPRGGCCHLGADVCSNEVQWICEADGKCQGGTCVGSINAGTACADDADCTGVFQGVGQFCATCEGGSNAGAPCQTCSDGTTACDSDVDCTTAGVGGPCAANQSVCNSGLTTCSNNSETICSTAVDCPGIPAVCSNSPVACVFDTDCPVGGTCGGAGTCDAGVCATLQACGTGACCGADGSCSITNPAACTGTFEGEGTTCEPNCCLQPTITGRDHCGDVVIDASNTVGALQPNDPPVVLTFTGNNSTATAVADTLHPNGDSCFGEATTTASDRGWWEGFSLTDTCTRVRIDLCCTTPTAFANWPWLATDCACGNIVVATLDPNTPELRPNARGGPFCAEDNLWNIMGLLGPGTYYYSIRSALEGSLGPYTFHVVAEPCPDAACCDAGGNCVVKNVIECNAIGGFFLGVPNKFPATAVCVTTPPTCGTGSCCLGPGICEDEVNGTQFDLATCGTAGGNFLGGVRCEGGVCVLDDRFSCDVGQDCVDANVGCPGGGAPCCISGGGARGLAQPNPCPLCEFEKNQNCQRYDHGGNGVISDLNLGSGIIQADDFVASAALTTVDQVCVWGFYTTKDNNDTDPDCSGRVASDNFRVRIFQDNGFGVPDESMMLGESRGSSVKVETDDTDIAFAGSTPWGFQITLTTPITGFVADQTYWLEVANDLDTASACFWSWTLVNASSPDGNGHLFGGSQSSGYRVGGEGRVDAAWCLPGAVSAPPTPVRPSCSCVGDCLSQDLLTASTNLNSFKLDAVDANNLPLECAAFVCPADGTPTNDDFSNALEVPVGSYSYETFCASTDGLAQEPSELGVAPVTLDVWYTFHAAQDCQLLVSQCATGAADASGFDAIMGLYTNGTTNCPDPRTTDIADATRVHQSGAAVLSDEDCCAGQLCGGPGFVSFPAVTGQCFTIRAAAFAGQGNERGRGIIDISCGPEFCGDGRLQTGNNEECDGDDLGACTACHPAKLLDGTPNPVGCTCAVAFCGNGILEGSEECDGTSADAACPGGCDANCKCVPNCGNGLAEPGEDCDGSDDSFCPGRCLTDCSCPVKVCGNNFADPGEECDGTDNANCPDGRCRADGDPAGGCTCECGAVIAPVDPPIAGANTFDRTLEIILPASSAGTETAYRVTLGTLYAPANPQPANQLDFSAAEGTVRYLNLLRDGAGNPVTDCLSSAAFNTTYKCAAVGCTPEFADWGTLFGGAPVYVVGNAIIPDSTFTVAHLAASCLGNEATCSATSAEVPFTTARYGDSQPDGAVNVTDVVNTVDVVKQTFGSQLEYHVYVRNPNPAPQSEAVNVTDIVLHVDALKLIAYQLPISSCP